MLDLNPLFSHRRPNGRGRETVGKPGGPGFGQGRDSIDLNQTRTKGIEISNAAQPHLEEGGQVGSNDNVEIKARIGQTNRDIVLGENEPESFVAGTGKVNICTFVSPVLSWL